MTVMENKPLLILSLLLVAVTVVSPADIPGSNETWRPAAPINCNAYNASVPCLSPSVDQRYCLENGSIVIGWCATLKALCVNNISVEDDFSICTNSISDTQPQRPRAAVDSSNRTSTTAPPTVSSIRTFLNTEGRTFHFGEAVSQSGGVLSSSAQTQLRGNGETSTLRDPPSSTFNTSTLRDTASSTFNTSTLRDTGSSTFNTSTTKDTASSTFNTLFGSNKSSTESGRASSSTGTISSDSWKIGLSSNGTSTETASITFTTTTVAFTNGENTFNTSGTSLHNHLSPSTNQGTFNHQGTSTNQGTFNHKGTSTNQGTFNHQGTFTNQGTFNHQETSTNQGTLKDNENTLNTSETPISNDRNPFTKTSYNNEKLNMSETSLHNETNPFSNHSTSTNDEKTLNTSGTSFHTDQSPLSSIGSSPTGNGVNASSADTASFSNNKPLGSDQPPTNGNTSGNAGTSTNGNNTASVLHIAIWHVFLASLSLATFSATHQLTFF